MNSLQDILKNAKTIAIVGCSDDPSKPSYQVAKYLKSVGYKIIPVNPKYDSILDEKCYPSLLSITENIDIVDVFRKSEDILPIAEEAVKLGIKCFWMQLGIKNKEAKELLENNNITVVEDTCIKIFHSSMGAKSEKDS
ncbi:MAG: CoA-binding protein [Proteobacteria bacterium]|nr:CoA-binding protein [Pseudomonadota bacterium]